MNDKQRGCMYGLAIGDALGAPVEFYQVGSFEPVVNYRAGGAFSLQAGEWTDDTSMALALADSIAHGWDTTDQLKRYIDWFHNGTYSVNGNCFDIGTTTRYALTQFELTQQIKADDDDACSGNGCIMRLAPVPIKYWASSELIPNLVESCRTTHGSQQCIHTTVAMGLILTDLFGGASKQEAIENCGRASQNIPKVLKNVLEGSYATSKVQGSGWVIASFEAALWAFTSGNSFEEVVLKAVNLGDDADTTGAVAGQLAGAFYGYSGIPQHLIDGLAKKEMIDKYLNPLLS